MESELFHILQDLKREINCLNLKYLQEKLEVINFDCMYQEDNFNYYNRKFFLNNLKFLLLKILMLGKCTKFQKEKYETLKANLEANLDKIETKYNSLVSEYNDTELLFEKNINKEVSLKNNFNQIDKFLEYVDKLSKEEKEKIFSYKMGVTNG